MYILKLYESKSFSDYIESYSIIFVSSFKSRMLLPIIIYIIVIPSHTSTHCNLKKVNINVAEKNQLIHNRNMQNYIQKSQQDCYVRCK